eukprot:354334-Chlamydomonas_euryale.AAC.5
MFVVRLAFVGGTYSCVPAVASCCETAVASYFVGNPFDARRVQAAFFMRNTIADAYDKWTTGVYDVIQNMQNRIPY